LLVVASGLAQAMGMEGQPSAVSIGAAAWKAHARR